MCNTIYSYGLFDRGPGIWAMAFCCMAMICSMSCDRSEVVTPIPEDHARLKGIVTLYAYASQELGRPPQSAGELLPICEKANIQDPQNFLTSTRDGRPYLIVWGINLESSAEQGDVPLAYEEVGKDGRRLVVTINQNVSEMTDKELLRFE